MIQHRPLLVRVAAPCAAALIALALASCTSRPPAYTMLLAEGDVTIDGKKKRPVGASLPSSVEITAAGTAVFRHDATALISIEHASLQYSHAREHGTNRISAVLSGGNAVFRIRPREGNETFTVSTAALPIIIEANGGTFALTLFPAVEVHCLAGSFEMTDGTNRRTMLPGRSIRWPSGESISNAALTERMQGLRMLPLSSMRGERIYRISGDEGITISSSSGGLGMVPLAMLLNPAGIALIASAPGKRSARLSLGTAADISVSLVSEYASAGIRRFAGGIASVTPVSNDSIRFLAADTGGTVYALDGSLSKVWSKRLALKSLSVEGDTIAAVSSEASPFIHALAVSNGAVLAVTAAPFAPAFPPCRLGTELFYLSANGDGFFYSLADRSVIPARLNRKTPIPPVSDGTSIFIIDGKGILLALSGTNAKARELASLAGKFSSPVVMAGKDIIAVSESGIVHRVDTASGAIVHWYSVPKGLSLAHDNSTVYGCSRGVLRLGAKPETVFMPMHEAIRSKPLGNMFAAFTMTGIDLYSQHGDRMETIALGTFASDIISTDGTLVITAGDAIHLYR